MITIKYKPEDKRYIFVLSDNPEELILLEKHMNKTPSYQFMPSFRGIPKPEVFLHKAKLPSGHLIYYTYSGLWKEISDWCKKKKIGFTGIDDAFKYNSFCSLSLSEFKDYVNNWELSLTPYDYQYKAAWLILKYNISLSELATRSGKTLIAYMVFRFMLEHGAHNILMIVPSIHLLKQGVKDMDDYKEFFKTETVWANSELCHLSNLTIGTFQSLIKMADKKSKKYNPNFFKKYDVVCVDEAHHLPCASIKTILSLDSMKFLKLKFGFTGTLPKSNTIESFACQALMGPKIQTITAHELIELGTLAKPIIKQFKLHYSWEEVLKDYIKCGEYLNSIYVEEDGKKISLPKDQQEFTIQHVKKLPKVLEETKKLYEPDEYAKYLIDLCSVKGANLLTLEQMLVHRSMKRIKLMEKLLDNVQGNGIVFAHNDTYLTFLKNHFANRYPDRPIYLIKGSGVTLKKRMKIIENMLTDTNAILFASYGCCGTGLTFKNVDWGIFAQSFKSDIINKQSIGRLMLKGTNKDTFMLYDIVDCFPTECLAEQGKEKLRIFKKEKYDYESVDYE